MNPQILLLDEPAAGMNPNETRDLLEFVKMLNEDGYTIAVIEHDMKFVMNLCKNILVLNFGTKNMRRASLNMLKMILRFMKHISARALPFKENVI